MSGKIAGMKTSGTSRWRVLLLGLCVLLLGGCAAPRNKAPVEERTPGARPASVAPAANTSAADASPRPLPGAENAGKPDYYTVKPGDTLIRIGLDTGQSWRDVARWNGLENPNLLEVGQVLRVAPPLPDSGAVTARAVAGAGRVETRPLDSKTAGAAPGTAGAAAGAVAAAPVMPAPSAAASAPPAPASVVASSPAAAVAASPRDASDDLVWVWPASGAVLTGFDEQRSRGLAIAGKAGDPVLAAGDGRVVYVGSAIRGYGNLVIVKHNDAYITAYAHNQTLLVKEDQIVRRGQRIAEMGSSDSERVQLGFEIRRQGKPIDPVKVLPAR